MTQNCRCRPYSELLGIQFFILYQRCYSQGRHRSQSQAWSLGIQSHGQGLSSEASWICLEWNRPAFKASELWLWRYYVHFSHYVTCFGAHIDLPLWPLPLFSPTSGSWWRRPWLSWNMSIHLPKNPLLPGSFPAFPLKQTQLLMYIILLMSSLVSRFHYKNTKKFILLSTISKIQLTTALSPVCSSRPNYIRSSSISSARPCATSSRPCLISCSRFSCCMYSWYSLYSSIRTS